MELMNAITHALAQEPIISLFLLAALCNPTTRKMEPCFIIILMITGFRPFLFAISVTLCWAILGSTFAAGNYFNRILKQEKRKQPPQNDPDMR